MDNVSFLITSIITIIHFNVPRADCGYCKGYYKNA